MRFCRHCGRMVQGVKKIGVMTWLVIILSSGVTAGLFLLFWIPWFLAIKKHECPICGSTELLKTEPNAPPSS